MQGLAETVPVSSSAHLTLLELDTTAAAALHAGSCAGIAWALRQELRALSARDLALIGAATVPAAAAGLLLQDVVEERLGTRRQLAALLAAAGGLLWLADQRPEEREVGVREAAAAGLAQVVALAPGVSRSGATLTVLRLLRVRREDAHRFTVLMSLPVTAGAAGLTLLRARSLRGIPLAGVPVAGLVAAASTAGQRRRGAVPVGWSAAYRLALAAAIAVRETREKP
ncbi:MAG: undecaprenyl-diphosphate phosphatase [Mycobacteriales bacterium]